MTDSAWDAITSAFKILRDGPTPHPFEQISSHFGDDPCSCLLFLPTEPYTLTLLLAGPVHPDVVRPVLRVRGAYCRHPQLADWRLVELVLPGVPCVFPWPPALTDAELGGHVRALAARRTGHDPGLIAVSLPDRDCVRHAEPPLERPPQA